MKTKVLMDVSQYQEAIIFIQENNPAVDEPQILVDKLIKDIVLKDLTMVGCGGVVIYRSHIDDDLVELDITIDPSVGKQHLFTYIDVESL